MERPSFVPENATPARFVSAIGNGGWMGSAVLNDGRPAMRWYYLNQVREPSTITQPLQSGQPLEFPLDHADFIDACADDLIILAEQDSVPVAWIDVVVPSLLASHRVDAMTKLRLAARWAEAKA